MSESLQIQKNIDARETTMPQNIKQAKKKPQVDNNQKKQGQAKQGQAEPQKGSMPLVLIVEDDRSMLMMLENRLIKKGYKVITAQDGKSAREQIEKYHLVIDAMLLDRGMPDIDGLEIVEWLDNRDDLVKIPIIMQTGADKPEQIKEGIDAGVFYYLTKPIKDELLTSVLNSAIKDSRRSKLLRKEMEKHKTGFSLIHNARFYLRTLEEAEDLSCFIANSFPDPTKILPGIAELIINAVEHGKCKVSYEEKSKLVKQDKWRAEVDRRCHLKENINKLVEVIFQRKGNRYSIRVADKGDGFLWKKYMQVDPSRAMDNHGRGIARANMLFNKLIYNRSGNIVIAVVDPSLKDDIDW